MQHGFRYEPNLRHAELIVSELGLERAKSASSLWTDVCDSSKPVDAEQFKTFQPISARVNFPAQDRLALQFTATQCVRKLSKPSR